MKQQIKVTEDDLALPFADFFEKCKEGFGWKDATKRQYTRYVARVAVALGNLPFEDIDEPTFRQATEQVRRGSSEDSDTTLSIMVSVFHDLCRFAEKHSEGLYFDVCVNQEWRQAETEQVKKPLAERTHDEIAQENKARIRRATRLPRSLTILQEQHLVKRLRKNYARRGSYMALAMMLYLGLRPAECLGVTFGDIRSLPGYEGIRCLYVYKQRKDDATVDCRLKTRNAYRILPIPQELDDLLRQREKGMRKRLTGDLSAYPVVCKDTKWEAPCRRRTAMEVCTGILRQEFKDSAVICDLTAEMQRDTAFEEKDITAYLLRRNFATAMVGVCGMEEDELQYLMGHDITDEQEQRSDFLSTDMLARIWEKMNRRVLWGEVPDEEPMVTIRREACRESAYSEMMVEIPTDCFGKEEDKVVLDLWNTLPGDYIEIRPEEPVEAEKAWTIDTSYEPVEIRRADRINIAPQYWAAVRKVRNQSKRSSKKS